MMIGRGSGKNEKEELVWSEKINFCSSKKDQHLCDCSSYQCLNQLELIL